MVKCASRILDAKKEKRKRKTFSLSAASRGEEKKTRLMTKKKIIFFFYSPLGLASSGSMSITASLTYVVLPIGATAPAGVARVALRYIDWAVESRLLVNLEGGVFFSRRFFFCESEKKK